MSDDPQPDELLTIKRHGEAEIPLGQLRLRPDARLLDNATLDALTESVREIGFTNPILVRPETSGVEEDAPRYQIIAGAHRYTVAQRLALETVPCHVVICDDRHAELAMIDENLMRAELSPSERARSTARRKAIYLELHPETAHGVAGGLARSTKADDKLSAAKKRASVPAFAEATAKATGRDVRTVQRDAVRGERVIEAALHMLRGTALDTGTYLDHLKTVPPDRQIVTVQADLAERRSQSRRQAGEKAVSAPVIVDNERTTHSPVMIVGTIEADKVNESIWLDTVLASCAGTSDGAPFEAGVIAPPPDWQLEYVREIAVLVRQRMGAEAPCIVSIIRQGLSEHFAEAISAECLRFSDDEPGGSLQEEDGRENGRNVEALDDDDGPITDDSVDDDIAQSEGPSEPDIPDDDFEMIAPGIPRVNRHERRKAAAERRRIH